MHECAGQGGWPLMLIGQDKCIFFQYLVPKKSWTGPLGERPLLPKSDGDGFMLSGFQSHDFGFGRPMTEEELRQVNLTREGKKYIDEDARNDINKTLMKPVLKESPFVQYFMIGVANDSYWNSNHMALQLEDIIDCLKVLYPGFDFVVIFDHSQGHDKKQNSALASSTMNKDFGGAAPSMRDTQIGTENVFLGPHDPKLKVGDVQSMMFDASDDGPFWLSAEDRQARQLDVQTGSIKTQDLTKKELIESLTSAGVQLNSSHTKKVHVEFAQNHNLPTNITEPAVKYGWYGKPKGLLQTLWERGLLNLSRIAQYTVDGQKDCVTGNVDLSTSLRYIMGQCPDFANEKTALQSLGNKLGISVDQTPKFHAELAGEGMEYSWAFSKMRYQRQPMKRKKVEKILRN